MHLLKRIQKKVPFVFHFEAVILSYGMGEDYREQVQHCEKYGIPCEVVESEIFQLAQEKINANSSFCSFFSRMRRGALVAEAVKRNCNKLALGHHLDDAVESLFMNMLYNGTIRSLPPKYVNEQGITVIRPLCEVRERDLRVIAEKSGFPIVGDEMCPAFRMDIKMPHARAKTKELLANIEKENPEVFHSLRKAMGNVQEEGLY